MIHAYLRVSSEKQVMDAQRGAVEEFCKLNDLPVDVWQEIEISSRKSMVARGIDGLIEKLKSGDVLIVSEISRLARSVGEIATICDLLLNKKVRLICIKERIDLRRNGKDLDISSQVQITMFGLFAQIERSLCSIRTREGLAATKAKGTKLGCPHPERGAKTQKKNALTFAKTVKGEFSAMSGMSQRAMVRRLNERAIPARNGGQWSVRSVQRVIDRLG